MSLKPHKWPGEFNAFRKKHPYFVGGVGGAVVFAASLVGCEPRATAELVRGASVQKARSGLGWFAEFGGALLGLDVNVDSPDEIVIPLPGGGEGGGEQSGEPDEDIRTMDLSRFALYNCVEGRYSTIRGIYGVFDSAQVEGNLEVIAGQFQNIQDGARNGTILEVRVDCPDELVQRTP